MYSFLIVAACLIYAVAFIAALQLGGRDSPRPTRGHLTLIFGGLAVSGALLMIARNASFGPPQGDALWDTILNRAPDYVPMMIVITASIACSNVFFGGANRRAADRHIAVPGKPRLPGEDRGPAGG
ncbi:hypothetical protein G4Z16_02940 [Streptomyces bathyalis]|uniref:Uncharacterized protein n=1 Tax=Streptomyces bathyalis TaxID=2710756 RepID=A0A7T1T344_9ACTN|nr:hypothetical protein [Streptomyces bathyalis]QPP05518.1 hypothetical protein G4Z16_02940 [Streptomyces bathyalis]